MFHRWRLLAAALVVVVVTAVAVVAVVVRTGAGDVDAEGRGRGRGDRVPRHLRGRRRSGRRTDQGGDTVSEGQAYGMLVAVGLGDEARFRTIWSWTAANLQGADGLLAWRWADGAVVDASPAADADLIAAGALALAGQRFGDPALVADGREISAAVLAAEAVPLGPREVLVAGPWAVAERVVNPSYFVLGMMSLLYGAGESGWQPIAASSRRLLAAATDRRPA